MDRSHNASTPVAEARAAQSKPALHSGVQHNRHRVCLPHPHSTLCGWQIKQSLCRTRVLSFFLITITIIIIRLDSFFFFLKGSYSVAQAGLELLVLLLCTKCWNDQKKKKISDSLQPDLGGELLTHREVYFVVCKTYLNEAFCLFHFAF